MRQQDLMSSHNPYQPPGRASAAWFSAGPATSFPNITASSSSPLSARLPLPCTSTTAPSCKVFLVPKTDATQAEEAEIDDAMAAAGNVLREQVVVFRYQGRFYAVDHRCPHSSFPLSRATPFDIEDFGIRLSAGLRCPKHDWSFDLVRGNSDRGSYRLGIWEVQLRRIDGTGAGSGVESKMVGEGYGEGEEEVWVRRKQRMG